jgi:hypothetical protein
MRLSSARELKAALRDAILEGMADVLRREGALILAASRAAATPPPVARTLALGIARVRGDDFRLAVRIQRRGLEDAARLAAIRQRARGEVDVRYVGRVAKQVRRKPAAAPKVPWHQGRTRPLLIGATIGHHRITAGTLGGFVVLRKGGQVRALSNNHVLADEDRGKKGDAILQPGAYDGGRATRDRIGSLDQAVKLKPRGTNRVDAALCAVAAGIGYNPRTLRGVGTLEGMAKAPIEEMGMVEKLGRTTGHTRGRVTAFELDNVVVAYDTGNLRFDDQIEIEGADDGSFSQGGDSGSLVFASEDHGAVGLLFAGSDQGGGNGAGLTYVNALPTVLSQLKADLLH